MGPWELPSSMLRSLLTAQCRVGSFGTHGQVSAELGIRSKFGRTRQPPGGCKCGERHAWGLKALGDVPGFASPVGQSLDSMLAISLPWPKLSHILGRSWVLSDQKGLGWMPYDPHIPRFLF